jgi:hypothetical protein
MPRAQFAIGSHRPRQQQHDAGTQTFAPSGKQMLCSGLKNGVTGSDQAAQIGQQGIQISLNGLEQLCNRCHNTSAVARS